MIDNKLLALLIVISIYVFFIKPLNEPLEIKKMQLSVINRSIAKELFIEKQKKKIAKLYPEYEKIINSNKKKLFPSSTPVSSDLSQLQHILKSLLKKNNMELVSINWGEAIEKKGYKKLPISFMARVYPEQLNSFFKEILTANKLIRFEQISISKYRKDKLLINAIIIGFKRDEKI